MIDALRIFKFALRDFWEEFVLLVLLNLLWTLAALLSIAPLLIINSLGVIPALAASILLTTPLTIVSGALCYVTNQLARGKAVNWTFFSDGVRRYWRKSLAVAAINLVVLFLIATNILFYFLLEGAWTNYAMSVWLLIAFYWFLVQIFWFPMILELEKEKVLLALRNALAMVLITPGFTITLGLGMILFVVLSVVLSVPALLLMVSVLLLVCNHATRSRLAYVRKEPYRPGLVEED